MQIEIIRGSFCGFCSGVMRAIDTARKAAREQGKVYTLGPVIHNPQVVEKLKENNIIPVDDLNGLKESDTVLIRSHGVTAELESEIRRRGFRLIDATCPKVRRAQRICGNLARDFGRVFIIGLSEHPEVKGIVSRAPDKTTVISSTEEAAALGKFDDAGVLVQTTFRREKFYEIVAELLKKSRVLKIDNTICEETISRQEEVSKIAAMVDVLYVVGGKNSSNTKRLYETGSRIIQSHYVEQPEEINAGQLTGKKRIGIVTGASTPIEAVVKIEEKINFEINKIQKGRN